MPLPTLCGNARRVQTTQRCWEPCCLRVLRTLLFSMMSVCHSSCYQCVSFYCYIDLRQSPHRIDHLNALQVSDMPGEYIHQTQLHHDTPRSHVSNVCIHCQGPQTRSRTAALNKAPFLIPTTGVRRSAVPHPQPQIKRSMDQSCAYSNSSRCRSH